MGSPCRLLWGAAHGERAGVSEGSRGNTDPVSLSLHPPAPVVTPHTPTSLCPLRIQVRLWPSGPVNFLPCCPQRALGVLGTPVQCPCLPSCRPPLREDTPFPGSLSAGMARPGRWRRALGGSPEPGAVLPGAGMMWGCSLALSEPHPHLVILVPMAAPRRDARGEALLPDFLSWPLLRLPAAPPLRSAWAARCPRPDTAGGRVQRPHLGLSCLPLLGHEPP